MTHITPCAQPENNADDWYIRSDGKQYGDDVLVFEIPDLIADARANGDERPEEDIVAAEEAAVLKAAIVRRRHAKDRCHTECYFRLQCLDLALSDPPEVFGTWGGYYEEELRVLRDEVKRRKRARTGLYHIQEEANGTQEQQGPPAEREGSTAPA